MSKSNARSHQVQAIEIKISDEDILAIVDIAEETVEEVYHCLRDFILKYGATQVVQLWCSTIEAANWKEAEGTWQRLVGDRARRDRTGKESPEEDTMDMEDTMDV